jgi:hypothetical protein
MPLPLALTSLITLFSSGCSMLSSGSTSGKYVGKSGSSSSVADQNAAVFASVFVIVWCGAAVVTVNAVLLRGSVCVPLHPFHL